jgi:hypothetical protein
VSRSRKIITQIIKEASKLIGSAGSITEIQKLITKWLMGTEVKLDKSGDSTWTVSNSKGPIDGLLVKLKGGRYRLEMSPTSESVDTIKGKFPGMRDSWFWVVYPFKEGDKEIIIQMDKRIAKVNLDTGKALLSANGKATFVALSKVLGATEVTTPKDMLDQLKKLKPNSGTVRVA